MADALARAYHTVTAADHRSVTIVPNCRDAGAWTPDHKEPFIFSAGRLWDPAKNLRTLEAIASYLPWPVYVAGARAAPDGHAVEFTKTRQLGRLPPDAIKSWMARASIYVLPARYEPFGLSILEAALSGCALVLGDIASLRENWSGVARFVHPDRPDELCLAVQELIDAPEARRAAGEAARERGKRFSPHAHVTAYARLYQEMVATHDRPAHSTWTL
jgi:glycosyltransferase involved in cell wall biosynthesis